MSDRWIIRVDGKDYGPADVATLREWKAEGRVLPSNDARRTDATEWEKAESIPGLFEPPPLPPEPPTPSPPVPTPVSSTYILPDTFVIYVRGFVKYFGLTMLVIAPAICAQVISSFVETTAGPNSSTGSLLAGTVALCLLLLGLVMTPIYIAAIQILTAAYAAGERLGFFATLNEAVKYWPRVAFLWVFVFVCYAFWAIMPGALILSIWPGKVSLSSALLILVVLTIMIWVTVRLFVNFMFWQQFAVLEGCDALESLRRSRELARSGRDLPWYRRPMWRGALIALLWFAVVLALNWPAVSQMFIAINSTTDPQKLPEAISAAVKNAGAAGSTFAANILQAILKPLLGIAFVLLFLDSKLATEE
ncbi:MAG TPA: DUF4339 domain-containing protein [Chthoniobacterales bacterium]|nr:DUF4339 domain-containing protein [Chthoniobacterales bacterium]